MFYRRCNSTITGIYSTTLRHLRHAPPSDAAALFIPEARSLFLSMLRRDCRPARAAADAAWRAVGLYAAVVASSGRCSSTCSTPTVDEHTIRVMLS